MSSSFIDFDFNFDDLYCDEDFKIGDDDVFQVDTATGKSNNHLNLEPSNNIQMSSYLEAELQNEIHYGDKSAELITRIDLADLYMIAGKKDRTKMHLEKAVIIAIQLGEKGVEAKIHIKFADLYLFYDDGQQALLCLYESLIIAKEICDINIEIEVTRKLMEILYNINNYPLALNHAERYCFLCKKYNHIEGLHTAKSYINQLNKCLGISELSDDDDDDSDLIDDLNFDSTRQKTDSDISNSDTSEYQDASEYLETTIVPGKRKCAFCHVVKKMFIRNSPSNLPQPQKPTSKLESRKDNNTNTSHVMPSERLTALREKLPRLTIPVRI